MRRDERVGSLGPKVIFANANLGDPRGPLCLISPKKIGHFATAAGFDGVEWTPIFDLVNPPTRVASAVIKRHLNLFSFHAAYRETRRSHGTNEKAPGAQITIAERMLSTPLGRIAMPEMVNSMRFRRRLGEELEQHDFRDVTYPTEDQNLHRKGRYKAGAGTKYVQVTDHVSALLGARTPEELTEKLYERGYFGWIFDTVHMHPDRYGGQYPRVVSDLDRSLPVLQECVYGVHVALNRLDIAPPGSDFARSTRNDLAMALNGEFRGVTGEIMAAGWSSFDFTWAVLEATAAGVHDVTGHSAAEDLQTDYRTLGQSIREFKA